MYNIHLKKILNNGKTYEYYTLNYKVNGKRYLTLTANNKDDLIRKVEKLEGKNVNYNIRLDAPTSLRDLFNNYLDTYIKGSRSIGTYISYKADVNNHILPYFNGCDYKDMTSTKIQEFYNYLINDKHLSSITANKVYLILKETLDYGVSLGIFYHNPCNKTIKKKAKEHRLSSPIKPEYLGKMWEQIGKSKYSNLYKLMLYTSLRRGEALGIKINDINLKDKTVYIHDQVITYYLDNKKHTIIEEHTKTHLSRLIALSDDAIKFISDELNREHYKCISNPSYHNEYGLLFTDDLGNMLEPSSVSRTLKDIAKVIECPNIRLHDLRHTGATIMYEATGNIYAVQKALGHEDPRTTEHYVGPSIKLQQESAKKVAEALNKQLDNK